MNLTNKMEVLYFNSFEKMLEHIASYVSNNTYGKKPLTEVNESPDTVNLDFFIEKIAKKKGWKVEKTVGWLNSIAELNTATLFCIILREIAVYLDTKYEDHIENSEKIYVVSLFDGRIHEVNKAHIKNYRNFAAFRTIEDAKFACNLLRNPLKGMFKNAKRK